MEHNHAFCATCRTPLCALCSQRCAQGALPPARPAPALCGGCANAASSLALQAAGLPEAFYTAFTAALARLQVCCSPAPPAAPQRACRAAATWRTCCPLTWRWGCCRKGRAAAVASATAAAARLLTPLPSPPRCAPCRAARSFTARARAAAARWWACTTPGRTMWQRWRRHKRRVHLRPWRGAPRAPLRSEACCPWRWLRWRRAPTASASAHLAPHP